MTAATSPVGTTTQVQAVLSRSEPDTYRIEGDFLVNTFFVTYKEMKYQMEVRKSIDRAAYEAFSTQEKEEAKASVSTLKDKLIADLNRSDVPPAQTIRIQFIPNSGYVAYVPKANVKIEEVEQHLGDDQALKPYCDHVRRITTEEAKEIATLFLERNIQTVTLRLKNWQVTSPNKSPAEESSAKGTAVIKTPIDKIEMNLGEKGKLLIDFEPTPAALTAAVPPDKEKTLQEDLEAHVEQQLNKKGSAIEIDFREGTQFDLRAYEEQPKDVIQALKEKLADWHYDLVVNDHSLTVHLPHTMKEQHAEELVKWTQQELSGTDKDRYGNLIRRSVPFKECKSYFEVKGSAEQGKCQLQDDKPAQPYRLKGLKNQFEQQLRSKKPVIQCEIKPSEHYSDDEALVAFLEVLNQHQLKKGQHIRLTCPNNILIFHFHEIDQIIEQLKAGLSQRQAAEQAAQQALATILANVQATIASPKPVVEPPRVEVVETVTSAATPAPAAEPPAAEPAPAATAQPDEPQPVPSPLHRFWRSLPEFTREGFPNWGVLG